MPSARRLLRILPVLILCFLPACGFFSSGEGEPAAPPTATIRPTPIGTPPTTSLPGVDEATETPVEQGPQPLVLWTTEDYAPTSDTESGMVLLNQIQAFQEANDVSVDVVLKKRTGTGGLLDFLTTASTAAPSVLPDVITLSAGDLYRAARAGLLQPLNGLVSPELLEDQFSFARALTQMGEATMGVLYQADLHHVVYDVTSFDEPPLIWDDVYSSTVPFVFSPAAPADTINDVILIQYLAFGGELTNAEGQPALDPVQLAQALSFFWVAREADVIPRSVLDLSDTATAWATFRIDEAGMVQVPASIYLTERAGLSGAGFSTVPLFEPAVTTVGHGWALAIVTQDPTRQQSAAALIDHLLSPENSGAWTQAAFRLPTRQAALEAWTTDDAYVPFVRRLLTQAVPAANPDVVAAVSAPLAQALSDVLRMVATPEEAAQSAVEAIRAGQ